MRARTALLVALACTAPVLVGGGDPKASTRHPGRNGPLTERELEIGKIAWKYFENNDNADTCLVNSVDNYPSTTMWDVASTIGALVAARDLGIIHEDVFYTRIRCLLATLGSIELFDGALPNKAYDTRTAKMTNYANEPGAIGYSAIDLGRLLIWLRILVEREPYYEGAINAIVARWHFCSLLDRCGTMYGAIPFEGTVISLQEGRLGYEEYAAKGFQLWGFDTSTASDTAPMSTVRIEGVDVPYDSRDPRLLGAHSYVVTESYALDGLELNWDKADD